MPREPRDGRRPPRDREAAPAVPAWVDEPTLTVTLAEVRISLAFAAGLAEAEKNPMRRS